MGRPFFIKTDQQNLKYLLHQRIGTPLQQKWLSKLLGYAFVVEYKKCFENVVANALSRRGKVSEHEVQGCQNVLEGTAALNLMEVDQNVVGLDRAIAALPSSSGTLYIISFPIPTWVAELKASYEADSAIQAILYTFKESGNPPKGFSLVDGLLFFKSRIYLGPTSPLKSSILHHVHHGPLGGHSSYVKTLHRVKQDFYWPGMKKDLKQYIKECDVCQRVKHENCRVAGLLQPLPIPSKPWLAMSMDFIEGLPKSQFKSIILVVVDRLTKYVHFIALSHPYTASKVAFVYMQFVFKLHGMLASVVSDRDPIFTSRFWRELMKIQGVELAMSSAYHPQTNGQTEVVNRSLE